jgi:ParB-like chromosome segregation protein Spo0J
MTAKNPKYLIMSPELESSQSFMPMSESDKKRLYDDIKINGIRHPIICYMDKENGDTLVLAGWHRREIAIQLKLDEVPVEIVDLNPKERQAFVVKENLARRHLNTEQKQKLIDHLLKLNTAKSNKSIAAETGVTKETVKKRRETLEAGGEIRPVKEVKGADGKTYKKQSDDKKKLNPNKAEVKNKTVKEAPAAQLKKKVGVVRTIDDCLSDLHGQQRKQTITAIMEVIKKYK